MFRFPNIADWLGDVLFLYCELENGAHEVWFEWMNGNEAALDDYINHALQDC